MGIDTHLVTTNFTWRFIFVTTRLLSISGTITTCMLSGVMYRHAWLDDHQPTLFKAKLTSLLASMYYLLHAYFCDKNVCRLYLTILLHQQLSEEEKEGAVYIGMLSSLLLTMRRSG